MRQKKSTRFFGHTKSGFPFGDEWAPLLPPGRVPLWVIMRPGVMTRFFLYQSRWQVSKLRDLFLYSAYDPLRAVYLNPISVLQFACDIRKTGHGRKMMLARDDRSMGQYTAALQH